MRVQAQQRRIHVTNTGELPVSLTWKAPAPFALEPAQSDVLAPGAAQAFTVRFAATEASVYTAVAACALSSGASHAVRLTAIGKFPFVALDRTAVDFGGLLVGQGGQRTVQLANKSMVPATFEVAQGDAESAFSVAPTRGRVEAGAALALTVRFKPHTAGTASSETVQIRAAGGNTLRLGLRGAARSALVAISEQTLDFQDVPVGRSAKKVRDLAGACQKDWVSTAHAYAVGTRRLLHTGGCTALSALSACRAFEVGTSRCRPTGSRIARQWRWPTPCAAAAAACLRSTNPLELSAPTPL